MGRLREGPPHQDLDLEQVWLTILRPNEANTYDDVARVAGIEPLNDAFGPYGGRFATNGGERGWTPATDYIMDRGLVIISGLGSGLFWVADED